MDVLVLIGIGSLQRSCGCHETMNEMVLEITRCFPLDAAETLDTDDGIGNNADTDDDGDGFAMNTLTTQVLMCRVL